MSIQKWLDDFHQAWQQHNVEAVLALFTHDVEYWETPHYRIPSKSKLTEEWQSITSQENIQITSKVFSSSVTTKHAIQWDLQYEKDSQIKKSSGVYLISLNEQGLCNYFYYVGESA